MVIFPFTFCRRRYTPSETNQLRWFLDETAISSLTSFEIWDQALCWAEVLSRDSILSAGNSTWLNLLFWQSFEFDLVFWQSFEFKTWIKQQTNFADGTKSSFNAGNPALSTSTEVDQNYWWGLQKVLRLMRSFGDDKFAHCVIYSFESLPSDGTHWNIKLIRIVQINNWWEVLEMMI